MNYTETIGIDHLYTAKRFDKGSYTEVSYGPAANIVNKAVDMAIKTILGNTSDGKDKNVIMARLKGTVAGGLGGAVEGAIGAMMPTPTFLALEGLNWYSNHKARQVFEERISQAKSNAVKNYKVYCEFHDQLLRDSVNAIDRINRKKTVAKECFLLDPYDELRAMGKNVTYSDFKSDFIDLRKFDVNVKYEEIDKKKDENNEFVDRILNNLSDLIRTPKKLKSQADNAEIMMKDNEASMIADLIKLECFSKALKNIADIYTCLIDDLKPRLKRHLRDMSVKYAHDMSAIPKYESLNLNKIKTILQEMAATEIVGDQDDSTTVDDVIDTSNGLSEKFDKMKQSFAHI